MNWWSQRRTGWLNTSPCQRLCSRTSATFCLHFIHVLQKPCFLPQLSQLFKTVLFVWFIHLCPAYGWGWRLLACTLSPCLISPLDMRSHIWLHCCIIFLGMKTLQQTHLLLKAFTFVLFHNHEKYSVNVVCLFLWKVITWWYRYNFVFSNSGTSECYLIWMPSLCT